MQPGQRDHPTQSPKVFVSHSSEDKEAVRQLCDRLSAAGIVTWLDESELLPGRDWDADIQDALRRADAVLVCLSRSAVAKRGYLQKEIRRVLDIAEEQPEGVTFIIPVRLEPCDIPRSLSRWQSANLYEKDGFERILTVLGERPAPGRKPAGEVHAGVRGGVVPRWMLFALSALALLAVLAWRFGPELTSRSPQPAGQPPGAAAEPVKVPPDMVEVPGGTFLMGRDQGAEPEEGPAHEVRVASFWIDRYPVTSARYLAFVKATNRAAAPPWSATAVLEGKEQDPAAFVTWEDAVGYCSWLGKRLPTEAEWEFAARGTDGRLYPWGNAFGAGLANSKESSLGKVVPAGSLAGNVSPYGVFDMSGNLWQWCSDDFALYPGTTAAFAVTPGTKSIRGGSFESDRRHITTTTRNLERPSKRSPAIGFRCAKSP